MAEDDKKADLTNIMDLSKKLEASGELPDLPEGEGGSMEMTPIETIDAFDSIEDYSKAHPDEIAEEKEEEAAPPPPPADSVGSGEPVTESIPGMGAAPDLAAAPDESEAAADAAAGLGAAEPAAEPTAGTEPAMEALPEGGAEAPTDAGLPAEAPSDAAEFPVEGQAPSSDAPSDSYAGPAMDSFAGAETGAVDNTTFGGADAAAGEAPPADAAAEFAPPEPPADAAEFAPPEPPADAEPSVAGLDAAAPDAGAPMAEASVAEAAAAEAPATPPPTPKKAAPRPARVAPAPAAAPKREPLKELRVYAESKPVGRPAVQAAFPFSLTITGPLTPQEKEKLLELISTQQMGFREIDLEPQFQSERILLPRISEFAGVMLVQAFRDSAAVMQLGPADEIFSTADTKSEETEPIAESGVPELAYVDTADVYHPAHQIKLTPDQRLPGMEKFEVLDAITASATLRTSIVEAQSSPEYQELMEALQREVKFKAYRKGATAVLNFAVSLTPLALPTHYRLTAVGSAVRPARPGGSPPMFNPYGREN